MSDPAAIRASLEETRQTLVDVVRTLAPSELSLLAGDTWTVHDQIAHLAASETNLVNMAEMALQAEDPYDPNFNLAQSNDAQIEQRRGRSVDELVAELASARKRTIALLDRLTVEDLAKPGRMRSGRPVTVHWCIEHVGEHDLEHLAEIRKAIGR